MWTRSQSLELKSSLKSNLGFTFSQCSLQSKFSVWLSLGKNIAWFGLGLLCQKDF